MNALNLIINSILSQYNDNKILYLITFYNNSIILIEYNYYIYNKKLLIIIYYFKH